MTDVLFIDHAYHGVTGSSAFMVELLRQRFSVDVLYVDPEASFDFSLLNREFDVAYVWQLDGIVPLLLAEGRRVILSPMYDGSSGRSELYWTMFRNAQFVNFSYTLHERVQQAGASSLYVKYFPNPEEFAPATFDSDFIGFFWLRRPEHGLNLAFVDRLVGSSLSKLFLHLAPDVSRWTADSLALPASHAYELVLSSWFRDRQQLDERLSQANVYIAPRATEGIGMAFLEAMARGCVVLANDQPTHNEYIANYTNGILFDVARSQQVTLEHQMSLRIGGDARQTVGEGYVCWQADIERICRLIERTRTCSVDPVPEAVAFSRRVYASASRPGRVEMNVILREEIRHVGLLASASIHRSNISESAKVNEPWRGGKGISRLGYRFGKGSALRHIEGHWRIAGPDEHALRREGRFAIRNDTEIPFSFSELTLVARGDRSGRWQVSCGPNPVGSLIPAEDWASFRFALDAGTVVAPGELLDVGLVGEADGTEICLRSISFASGNEKSVADELPLRPSFLSLEGSTAEIIPALGCGPRERPIAESAPRYHATIAARGSSSGERPMAESGPQVFWKIARMCAFFVQSPQASEGFKLRYHMARRPHSIQLVINGLSVSCDVTPGSGDLVVRVPLAKGETGVIAVSEDFAERGGRTLYVLFESIATLL